MFDLVGRLSSCINELLFREPNYECSASARHRRVYVARSGRELAVPFLLQPGAPAQSVLSEVSISFSDWLAVSRLRIDTRFLSTAAPASSRGVQAESAYHANAPFHRLRFSRIHEKRDHRQAVSPPLHPAILSVGVARAAAFLLGLSQYALVSVRLLKSAFSIRFANRDELRSLRVRPFSLSHDHRDCDTHQDCSRQSSE